MRTNQPASEPIGAWTELVAGLRPERMPRSRVIYAPARPASELLLLAAGEVSLYLESERRALTLRTIAPGQLFGHVALVADGAYDSFARAQRASLVYRIPRERVLERIQSDDMLALRLLEDLGEHRLAVSRTLDEVAFKSVPARLASALLDMAAEEDSGPVARVPRRSHRQLAARVNAYRETVTKVLNQFRAARLLEIDRSFFTLLNRSGLEELAQGW
jgi:CRP/FNR family cyclic AMP-dependent transcriptional regulator